MAPKNNIPAYVLGVGLTKFIKPRGLREYPEMGYEAGVKAMFGMTSIPIYNTNNACATPSTGLHLARTLIKNGAIDCAMVIGFEKMEPGSIKSKWSDRPSPMGLSAKMMYELSGKEIGPPNPQFNQIYTLEEVEKSPMIHYPLTKLQCSPTSDGAGAAVIVSQSFLDARPHLKSQAILIAGQSLMTDTPELYSRSAMQLVGYDMTKRAARAALKEAGVSAKDIKVCEVHDCFSANELILLDGLGFSEPGKAHEMVRNGDITYGGQVVVNPSGGLISKGHPLGATGLAQCAELSWQLRGWAHNRLVYGSTVALQHNLGLGGAVVVNVYKRADGGANEKVSDQEIKSKSWLGYNAAVEARAITTEDAEKVRSRTCRSQWALRETEQKLSARL
ncbi:probable acetyl-CoA acetyltransferase [Rhynchosporium agropyri]|uniref:propanoyl-CoA C-acyltransferase n=1 Tax=Rhynchosporium agropyri TaxID=914238 RepID=A0A1E1K140_9HELO|nr:probable acetyl-CoA acetyltransferase [Rhynchosporium agropyri]